MISPTDINDLGDPGHIFLQARYYVSITASLSAAPINQKKPMGFKICSCFSIKLMTSSTEERRKKKKNNEL